MKIRACFTLIALYIFSLLPLYCCTELLAEHKTPPQVNPSDFIISVFETDSKRNLLANTSTSTVSGTGIVDIQPYVQYSVTATAKDQNSNNLNTGGDSFFVQISNECTKTDRVTCTQVGGAQNTLANTIEGLMTYNGDSTYTYNFTMTVTGRVSLVVIFRTPGVVHNHWYNNNAFSGAVAEDTITENIDYSWASGTNLCCSKDDDVSVIIESYIRPNISDTYTLEVVSDDTSGGVPIDFNGASATDTIISSLTAFNDYYLRLMYQEFTGAANINVYWSSATTTRQIIPYKNFVWPYLIGSSPYTFNIACQNGYTVQNNECYPVCGDGLKLGVEVCDDGNTANGDGCQSDCLATEFNCTCTGGGGTTKDTCVCYTSNSTTDSKNYDLTARILYIIFGSLIICGIIAAAVVVMFIECRMPIKYSRLQQRHERIHNNSQAQPESTDQNKGKIQEDSVV